jgi:hypothetical protein
LDALNARANANAAVVDYLSGDEDDTEADEDAGRNAEGLSAERGKALFQRARRLSTFLFSVISTPKRRYERLCKRFGTPTQAARMSAPTPCK